MPGIDYLNEREWVVYTIEEELNNLERYASAHQQFSDLELKVLHHSLVRLNHIVTSLVGDAEEEPLPHWFQRTEGCAVTSDSDDDKSESSAANRKPAVA